MMWPKEDVRRTAAQRAELQREFAEDRLARGRKYTKPYPEDEGLRRAVIEQFDDDAPRQRYAAWMLDQDQETARWIGQFIKAQLSVAELYRVDPRADVSSITKDYLGRAKFRAAPAEHDYDLGLLLSEGLIGNPTFYRGFVERVSVRADRFLEIADELLSLAPIRHLSLIGVPTVLDALAASPHLSRIRSLSLPQLSAEDAFTDDLLARFLASRYLGNIAHLRLGRQEQLTPHAYEHVVTASTLPRLSNFEVYTGVLTCWAEPVHENYDASKLSYFERVIEKPAATGDLRDTPKPVVLRPEDWIVDLERKLGYVPCVHPEEHYGTYIVDIEAVTAHPISLDHEIMARRGQPVPDPGPKPSLMQRRREGRCAICGSASLTFERGPMLPPDFEPYGNPMGSQVPTVNPHGVWICDRCGTRWNSENWPELPPPPP